MEFYKIKSLFYKLPIEIYHYIFSFISSNDLFKLQIPLNDPIMKKINILKIKNYYINQLNDLIKNKPNHHHKNINNLIVIFNQLNIKYLIYLYQNKTYFNEEEEYLHTNLKWLKKELYNVNNISPCDIRNHSHNYHSIKQLIRHKWLENSHSIKSIKSYYNTKLRHLYNIPLCPCRFQILKFKHHSKKEFEYLYYKYNNKKTQQRKNFYYLLYKIVLYNIDADILLFMYNNGCSFINDGDTDTLQIITSGHVLDNKYIDLINSININLSDLILPSTFTLEYLRHFHQLNYNLRSNIKYMKKVYQFYYNDDTKNDILPFLKNINLRDKYLHELNLYKYNKYDMIMGMSGADSFYSRKLYN